MRRKPGTKKKRSILFGIVTTILLIVFVFNVILFFSEFELYYTTYEIEDRSLLYRLEQQEYDDIYYYYVRETIQGKEFSGDRAKIYAIARYYHYATLYNGIMKSLEHETSEFAKESGTELMAAATQYKKEMDTAASEMEEFSYAKKDIDDLLSN